MKSIFSKLILGVLFVFIVIQFFRVDKSVPETDEAIDFLTVHQPPSNVESIFQTACYDCHSYETVYPWYSNIQPVAWWLQDHINEGRDEMNFSTWQHYSDDDADHYLEEIEEVVHEEEMPLPSYTWVHSDARLTNQQREALIDWVSELRTSLYQSSDASTTTETAN